MTPIEAAQILTILRAAYPRQVISAKQYEDMTAVWADILVDVPFDVAKIAALEYCGSSTWFPAVGQIRTMALDLVATDSDRITPGDAWDEVNRAFRNVGYTRSPEWSHPDIERAVKGVGGWAYLCHSDNPMADRARFLDIFKVYRKRAEIDRRMLPATREFVAQHRQIEMEGAAGLIAAEMKQLTDRMSKPSTAPYPECTEEAR